MELPRKWSCTESFAMALGISAYVYWREDYIRPVFRKRCTLQDYDAIVEVASPILTKIFVLKLLRKYI